jgi:hypothetical protein
LCVQIKKKQKTETVVTENGDLSKKKRVKLGQMFQLAPSCHWNRISLNNQTNISRAEMQFLNNEEGLKCLQLFGKCGQSW